MGFKVGDKVIIDLGAQEEVGESWKRFNLKKAIITEIDDIFYKLDIDDGKYEWNNNELRKGGDIEQINREIEEELECVNMYLDDMKAPKEDSNGEEYSTVGRIKELLKQIK